MVKYTLEKHVVTETCRADFVPFGLAMRSAETRAQLQRGHGHHSTCGLPRVLPHPPTRYDTHSKGPVPQLVEYGP